MSLSIVDHVHNGVTMARRRRNHYNNRRRGRGSPTIHPILEIHAFLAIFLDYYPTDVLTIMLCISTTLRQADYQSLFRGSDQVKVEGKKECIHFLLSDHQEEWLVY